MRLYVCKASDSSILLKSYLDSHMFAMISTEYLVWFKPGCAAK
jgi:hypothetical protein